MKPIPTPAPERWRRFRQATIPALVVGGVLCAVTALWDDSTNMVPIAGPPVMEVVPVSSDKAGVLSGLTVTRFQKVRQGDPLGYVLAADPKSLETEVAAVRDDLAKLRQSVETMTVPPQQRRGAEEVRARLNWLWQRVELATARVNLQLAETELYRLEALLLEEDVTLRELDLARASQRNLSRQVEELAERVAIGATVFIANPATGAVVSAELGSSNLGISIPDPEIRLRQVEADLNPELLRAPIDGIISDINFRSGEVVTPGSPIILIVADQPLPEVS